MSGTPAPPGAQRERTSLAWRRTALAFTLNGALLLRSPDTWLQIAALLILAGAAGVAAMSARSFVDPDTHGWFAGGKLRAELLVFSAASVAVLDLVAVTR